MWCQPTELGRSRHFLDAQSQYVELMGPVGFSAIQMLLDTGRHAAADVFWEFNKQWTKHQKDPETEYLFQLTKHW